MRSNLAVWDVVQSCVICGASDASIREVVPNAIPALIRKLGVRAVFCNGAAAGRLYQKYVQPQTGIPATVLPSTSPANAAWTPEKLRGVWGPALLGATKDDPA